MPASRGVEAIQVQLQHLRPMFDMLGTCSFQYVELGLDPEFYAQAHSAVVDREFSFKDLLWRAERVWNLTCTIWVMRKDVKLEDDMLPERDFTDPVPDGSTKGANLDKKEFRDMLQRYCRKRGWIPWGKPSKEKLTDLGLSEAVKALYG